MENTDLLIENGEESMDTDEDVVPHRQGYSILIEKGFNKDIKYVSWCSVMDLIAIVTSDNVLHIHRLSWQKVSTITPAEEKNISIVEWKPDGNNLINPFINKFTDIY